MVAVRFALLNVPEENVAVARPVGSVVTVEVLSSPVSALICICASGTAALVALTAVTVMVLESELSDFIVVGVPEI
jgi:acetyl-CoA carboxylase carboxyltransferase component